MIHVETIFVTNQRNVHDHGPVSVEEDLADEDEDECHHDAVLGEADPDEEERRGDNEADAADDRVDAREPLAQLETQPGPQDEPKHACHREHEAEDEGGAEIKMATRL